MSNKEAKVKKISDEDDFSAPCDLMLADSDLEAELEVLAAGNDDRDESEDTMSPEALAEAVKDMSAETAEVVGIINKRIEMYKLSEENAKTSEYSAKERRIGRGLKSLQDLLKRALSGEPINVDDIPPEVAVKSIKPQSATLEVGTEAHQNNLAQQ